jgi:NitT/TauT family transport system substrate-binding protein
MPAPTTSGNAKGNIMMQAFTKIFGLSLAAILISAHPGSADELTTIRLSKAVDSISGLAIAVAEDHGMFAKRGLKVEVIDFKGGAPAVQAIVAGDVAACLCAGDHVVNLTSHGFPAKIFIGLSDKHGYALMGPVDSKATDLKSLKGKHIGITSAGSQTDNTIRYDLREKGMNADTDVQIISIGTGGAMQAAIKSGAIEAGMFPAPFIEQNVKNGWKMIVDYRVYSYPSLAVLGLDKWLQNNKETAKKFVEAVREAEVVMTANKQLAMDAAKKMFPRLNDELRATVVTHFLENNVPKDGIVDPKGFKLMNDMVTMSDPSTKPVKYEDGVALDLLK